MPNSGTHAALLTAHFPSALPFLHVTRKPFLMESRAGIRDCFDPVELIVRGRLPADMAVGIIRNPPSISFKRIQDQAAENLRIKVG
jgi:hypothetical protein